MSGTLYIVHPGAEEISVETYPESGCPKLAKLQKEVGGYVERIRLRFEGRLRDAYVDEDGIMKGLRLNTRATNMTMHTGNSFHVIYGPMVIWVPTKRKKKSGQFD